MLSLFCMAIDQDWCKASSDVPTQMRYLSVIFRDWNLFNITNGVMVILGYTQPSSKSLLSLVHYYQIKPGY